MKALSVKQPYASALADGEKNIEFRSKPTKHRGELLICSSKSGGNIWWTFGNGASLPLPRGTMMAVRVLVDCRPMTEEDKAEIGAPDNIAGWYAWVFDKEDGRAVQPVAVAGSISFFEVEDSKILELEDDKGWPDYSYPNKLDKVPKDLIGQSY